jgi:hypothetical protein
MQQRHYSFQFFFFNTFALTEFFFFLNHNKKEFSYHSHTYIKYGHILSCFYYLLKMRLFVFLLLIVGCSCDLQILIDSNGGYNITINNKVWLRSSRTAIYADDRWYSTEDMSLPLVSITTAEGTDPILGNWNETRLTYNLVRSQKPTPIVARIRQWDLVSALTFYLETGDVELTTNTVLHMDDVRTVFPSFFVEKMDQNDHRGYFRVGGEI